MHTRKVLSTGLLFSVLAPLLTATALAQTYPVKPVRVIDGFPTGGSSDIVARAIAPKFQESQHQSWIVDNRAGAQGIIGADLVAKAPPDGYTFGIGTSGTLAYNQTLYRKPLYDAANDFAPVGLVGESFFVLLVRKDFPANTLPEFIAFAKANAAQMHFGSAGTGSATHIACELLAGVMGTRIAHIPYRSTLQAVQDLVAGRIDFVCDAGSTALQLIRGDVVKALANLGPRRVPMLPELATAREQGVAGVAVYGWNALYFPKGTPDPIVRAMNKAAGEMLARPAVQGQLNTIGVGIPPLENRSPEFLSAFIRSEIETWAVPITASGVKIE